MSKARAKVAFYFEHGYVITDKEQLAHDKAVQRVMKASKIRLERLIATMKVRLDEY